MYKTVWSFQMDSHIILERLLVKMRCICAVVPWLRFLIKEAFLYVIIKFHSMKKQLNLWSTHLEGTHTVWAHSVRSVHDERTTQFITEDRSSQAHYSPHYRVCLTQSTSRKLNMPTSLCGVAQAPYGYVYMCKEGYTVMVERPFFAPRNLLLDQFGFTSAAGSWLVLVLFFEEHDTMNPGFSLCVNKIQKLNLLYVAISKVTIRVWVGFTGVSEK